MSLLSALNRFPISKAANAAAAETQEYADARVEARDLCRNLGLDVDNEHWDKAAVADFIRLAYAQGYVACEKRLASPDVADAIALAIEHPERICTDPGYITGTSALRWQVIAVQQAAVYGVPR
jgi:hypothetical protein